VKSVKSKSKIRGLSHLVGFLAKQFSQNNKPFLVKLHTLFGYITNLYSCFYNINLINVQIFIRAEEKGKEEALIYIINEEMLKHNIA
jgi:hypothetical protein